MKIFTKHNSHLVVGSDDSGDKSCYQVLLVDLNHAGYFAQDPICVTNGSLVEQK
jgi:hypothetical protein